MYGRVFEHMYEGSMLGAGINVFAVWNYILAKARRGSVEVNPVLIAFKLGGTADDVVSALEFLQKPDPESRSKEEEGRRIVRDGQYQYRIVNWQHYEDIRNEAERRVYVREAVAKHRDKVKVKVETDAEWLATLASDPTYLGIDINKEYGKCLAWCGVNKRKATRRMFINWINRAEKPMDGNGAHPKAPTVFELKSIIEAKTKLADALKNKHATEGPLTTDWSDPKHRESHKLLRREIAGLTEKLGRMA